MHRTVAAVFICFARRRPLVGINDANGATQGPPRLRSRQALDCAQDDTFGGSITNSKMATPNNIVFTGSDAEDETSLLDILDHVLTQGAIIRGNIIISLAGVDLIYLGLDVVLTSVETALKHMRIEPPSRNRRP